MHESALIALAGIGVLASLCQWLAWRIKLPAILLLLLTGIVCGPVTGWLDPDALFGELFLPMVSLSVAVILFEGSLSLRFDEIQGVEKVVRRMVSTGLLVTWCVTTLATRWLLEFPWPLAFLFGALTVVTGPTVIVPMLRSVRPTPHLASILRWEGIVIDPIGALLAVLVFEFIISGHFGQAFGHTLLIFGKVVLVGLVLGAAAGQGLGWLLRDYHIPEYLHNVATLTLVFAVFALSNAVQEESGLLTVTVMGLWLANMKRVPVGEILDFKESLSLLLISGLFILLAARIDLASVQALGWGAVGVLLAMQFIARPLKILLSTLGSSLSWRERALLAWIAPRGIIAAAISAAFAIRLQQHGYSEASLLVPLTFFVIIGTVVLQGASARAFASWLGVAEPEPRGFLIVGANPVARAVAKALDNSGYHAMLVDSSWAAIRTALMDGLKAFYGSPVSEHADRNLDLVGIGSLLALSPQQELNSLAALRYRTEFGPEAIFTLNVEQETSGKTARLTTAAVGHNLFGPDVSYSRLAAMLSAGARVRETKLTDTFDFDAYYRQYYRRAVPLFAVDPRGRLHIFTTERSVKPEPGWTVLALVAEAETSPAAGEVPAASG